MRLLEGAEVIAINPQGNVISSVVERPAGVCTTIEQRNRAAGLAIDEKTIFPQWSGDALHLGDVVGGLEWLDEQGRGGRAPLGFARVTGTHANGEPVVVRAERLVAGGAALSRRDDGQIVLVDDALPGELVEVTIGRRHGADRGTVVRIVEPSPNRIAPRCSHVADGCGGCDLAALEHISQVEAKVELVTDSLRRLGRWREPVVHGGPALDPWGFRTTLRLTVTNGRAGLRRSASNEVVELAHCLVAHPRLDELIVDGRFANAHEVTLRVGAATGERLALVSPTRAGVSLPEDVRVVGADELAAGTNAWIHDDVAGTTVADLGRVVLPDPRRTVRPRWSTSCARWPPTCSTTRAVCCSTPTAGSGSSPARCSTSVTVGVRSPPRTTARPSPTRA